ncbi:cytochrome P450 monooxygenase-like protein [Massariosphaeria phaeospora]|uniref:Cytochrome P450 monooxygenase-like protein n=1 Tax=Massariosphaeria phaeospora TaxID=100035 RepID=A0A7C8MJY4_9PLEO|nr:cytochrome P450 monooxygenase-like protein [Massariosphaeria phaeospora]
MISTIAISSTPTLLCTVFIGYYIVQAVYNVFFHPLSKCPGFVVAKFSRLPSFYRACKGDRHLWIWQLHQIYGDKVRITPNEVLFLAPQAHRDIYGGKANVTRAKSYEAWDNNTGEPNTALATDMAVHARKRKILNQAFTDKALKDATIFMAYHIERWLDLLWCSWVVFDMLGDLCFGRSFEIKEPRPNPIREIPNHIETHLKIFYPILHSPFMESFVWAKPKGLDKLLHMITPHDVKMYHKFIEDSVSQRILEEKTSKDAESSRQDIFHYLCAAKDPETGKAYTEEELRAEAIMLIVAGSNTIIAILAGFWFYISRNPSAHDKLTKEIRGTFNIDECLRISPGGPSEFAREVLPGGTTVNGECFPQGVVIGSAHWAMGHNEDIFGDPGRFRPERYIPSEATGVTEDDVHRIKSYYKPFLIGPTNCVGQNVAVAEMALIIAKTMFRFELRAAPGDTLGAGHPSLGWGRRDERQFQVSDAYITVHDGPILQFRKRTV